MISFKNVLIPVDFSDFSKNALQTCSTTFAGDEPMTFHFLYVWRSPTENMGHGNPLEELEQQLEEFVEPFSHAGEHTKKLHVRMGHPALEICKYAEENNCDLIAISTHGRTGIAHLLIGSTSEQVIRHADCTVLSLRY